MKNSVYELIDEVLENISPEKLAEYIYMNDVKYAESLEFYLGIQEISELCNDALIEKDKDTKIIQGDSNE